MKTVRFIHTSDVHLDTSFSRPDFSSRLGDRKREQSRLFPRILEAARSGNVNLVLIAGDLFELERITPDTFEFLKRQFESLGEIRVFISPGNHDPCVPGSPYKEEAWPQNVHIFRTEEFQFVELPEMGVRVAGFGFTHSQLEPRLFQQLPVLPGDLFNTCFAMDRISAGFPRENPSMARSQ
jgi:hypothetical protein